MEADESGAVDHLFELVVVGVRSHNKLYKL